MVHNGKHLLMDVMAACLLASLLFLVSGCGEGLPKELKNQAKSLPNAIKAGQSRVNEHREKYIRLTKSPDFKDIETYASKENWERKFALAHQELSRAQDLYDKEITPLVSKNKPELAPALIKQVNRIQQILTDADKQARYPVSRFTKIKNSIDNTSALHARAAGDAEKINRIATGLQTGLLAKTLADFPDQADKINAQFNPLSELDRQSRHHAKTVAAEYERHTSGSGVDYAAFTDSVDALRVNHETLKTLAAAFTRRMNELYTSYTKILKDMKEEYYVTIKRESWDERSDYENPRFATFQRQVSPETYEALTADNLDTIAAITAGFTGSTFNSHVGGLWNDLHINPTAQWPGGGHNAASFWVENSKETYFHKYMLEKNGETKETDWEAVDENFYEANLENLGMAILAKPYGVFEQDRLIQAAPPGMAYVGNSQYGEWKTDEQGDRFWSWYGKYALFSSLFFYPPSYFYYNPWNGWRNNYRHTRPYYGKTGNGSQKYGTRGTYVKKSPRFQSTTFAKSGGFKSQTASVRGAGANLRGGGPKSKGK